MDQECVIAWRNTQNSMIGFLCEEDGSPTIFQSVEKAQECADNHPLLRAFPYEILEINI